MHQRHRLIWQVQITRERHFPTSNSRFQAVGCFMMEKVELKPEVQESDMSLEQQNAAVMLAMEAIEKFHSSKNIARHIKQGFDAKCGSGWHCVVGREFGAWFDHEVRCYIYYYVGRQAILLWRHGLCHPSTDAFVGRSQTKTT
ncbi:unnamed protein product [Soboliphyme baturini]|uniref:Dynein light chain n=1 Tax=Soboliphyme baturini TaxID=241478 RepID=A0A183IHW7_9BILA|nr:unnamed protein product [Soboliphyme baturini]